MSRISHDGDVLEFTQEMIDVTSASRPDITWLFIDRNNHEHRWYVGNTPAKTYSPTVTYVTPTLKWVHEEWGYYEDGEKYSIGHYECVKCGDLIAHPRTCSDTSSQYIAGMKRFVLNGVTITREEAEALVEKWKINS